MNEALIRLLHIVDNQRISARNIVGFTIWRHWHAVITTGIIRQHRRIRWRHATTTYEILLMMAKEGCLCHGWLIHDSAACCRRRASAAIITSAAILLGMFGIMSPYANGYVAAEYHAIVTHAATIIDVITLLLSHTGHRVG